MTEYDYSPEAYERYIATQNRIANWVDKTEQHRSQFENALSSVPTASPSRPGPTPLVPNHRSSKRSPPSSMPHQHPQHGHRPRELFIPPHSPASESSDDYGEGPGPMPMASPGMMMYPPPQQPAYHPMTQPMMSPPLIMVPPSYMTPHHKSSHHRHRPSHSHSHPRSYSQQSPAYYNMASPPITPGYQQYPFPQMMQGGRPSYIMMQPQQQQFGQRPQMPVVSGPLEPPHSAPPIQASFSGLPASAALVPSGVVSYLHARPSMASGPSSASTSPSLSPGSETDTTGTVSVTTMTKQPHYFASVPQYQGMHSAMASPPPLNGHIVSAMIPQNVHDLSSSNRHYLRRSIGQPSVHSRRQPSPTLL